MKIDLDPEHLRTSMALWRGTVDLKLDMRPDIRSHMMLMQIEILEKLNATAGAWTTLLSACTAQDEAGELQTLKDEVGDFKVWAHESLKALAALANET